jgi:hypothetical protein
MTVIGSCCEGALLYFAAVRWPLLRLDGVVLQCDGGISAKWPLTCGAGILDVLRRRFCFAVVADDP